MNDLKIMLIWKVNDTFNNHVMYTSRTIQSYLSLIRGKYFLTY